MDDVTVMSDYLDNQNLTQDQIDALYSMYFDRQYQQIMDIDDK